LKHIFNKVLKLVLAFGLVYACSPTKDTFVSRNMNALSTKFNILYNGNVAFEKGLKQLEEKYKDNFFKRIPIEPLQADDAIVRPQFNIKGKSSQYKYFDRAEEKAVKAIQAHSMNVRNEGEKNTQIDDAYMLLGKARYYTLRFVPALDAFNYTIKNYSKANLIYETRIWQAKTQIRLQNELYALEDLNKLLYKDVSANIRQEAYTAIAMAFNQIDSTEQVKKYLIKAIAIDENPVQNARNLFVLGQIHREQDSIELSNNVFNQLLNFKKAPYKFKIQAQIELAKNYQAPDSIQANLLLETLAKMIKNYDNKAFVGSLYYEMGTIEDKNKNYDKATDYYNLSLKAPNTEKYQKLLDYEALGIINFTHKKYLTAGIYYDSVIRIAEDKTTRKIRQIKRKRKKLDDVVFFETIANSNDSILYITSLDSTAQTTIFKNHIAYLKQREKDSIKIVNERLALEALKLTNSYTGSKAGGFYFYDNQLVGFGKNEFTKIWGARKLVDNWRYSDKSHVNLTSIVAKKDTAKATVPQKYTLSFYMSRIPKSAKKIDSLTKQRNNAYFNLGLIYKEQFKEYALATDKLEKLLTFSPDSNLILPAHYHLYKTFSLIDSTKAAIEKDFITTNFPKSHYAQIINNPNKNLVFTDENAPETKYKNVYNHYQEGHYLKVDSLTIVYLKTYQGLPIIPKFKLLRAYAIAKLDGLKEFDKAIRRISFEYPNTIEGKKAKKVHQDLKKELSKADNFKFKKNKSWYLALQVSNDTNVSKMTFNFRTIIYEEEFTNLKLVTKPYNRSTKLFLIKGFASEFATQDFTKLVHEKYKNVMSNDFFVISQSAYNKIQQHKNLSVYLKTIEKPKN
jgi:tetratricopeptide (TPR) repeat protein